MPSGPRRRATGLRREEVAVLANVSPTWYTYLEQGRRIRPSTEVLDSLADALRLDMAERRYLHALGAGPATSIIPDTVPDPDATDLVRRLVDASNAMPFPVYAADGLGTLIAWNAHMSEWYGEFSERPEPERNIVRWLFTAPEAQQRIAGWHLDARDIVSRIRYVIGTSRADPHADEMVHELSESSTEFRDWWSRHDVTDQDARLRNFRHPRLGMCTMQLLVVRPAVCPAVSVVFHLPC